MYADSLINHIFEDVQYEHIGEEEIIQDEYINDEREKNEEYWTADGMCKNDMWKISNMECKSIWTKNNIGKQGKWNTMRETKRLKENEWALIHSNQVMKNSQITNVCNDGEDNDLESLGKDHLSLARKIHNEIDTRRWESLESSHTNFHKQLTQ